MRARVETRPREGGHVSVKQACGVCFEGCTSGALLCAWLRIKMPKGRSVFKTLHAMKISLGEGGSFVDSSWKPRGDHAVAVGRGTVGAQRTFCG